MLALGLGMGRCECSGIAGLSLAPDPDDILKPQTPDLTNSLHQGDVG